MVLVGTASRIDARYVVHESRGVASSRWVKGIRVQSTAILPVRIGLIQSNLDKAEDYLMAVSHPDSATYGQHWTAKEVIEAFRPSEETVSAVQGWLEDAGIRNATLTVNKAWLAFDAPARRVEKLLRAEYYEYTDAETREIKISTQRYHLPNYVQQHVDYITPGLMLLAPRARSPDSTEKQNRVFSRRIDERTEMPFSNTDSACTLDSHREHCLKHCDVRVTPACIAFLYQIPQSTLQPNASNIMGIYESQSQFWDQTDLDLFFTQYTNGRIPNGTHPINLGIDGGQSKALQQYPGRGHGGEAPLDLEMSYPIIYPQKIGVFDENDLHYQRSFREDTVNWGFNQFLDAVDGSYCDFTAYGETGDLPGVDPTYPDPAPRGGYNHSLECGVFKPPTVLSVSYGGSEADLPIAYQKRQCLEFLKLGLQGTTLVWASGDTGVGAFPSSEHPSGCLGPKGDIFNPDWPSTCPWVTNVGATVICRGQTIFQQQPESVVYVAWDNYSSGGGFSNLYPIPAYQQAAVQHYLTKHTPPYLSYAVLAENAPNPIRLNITTLRGDTNGVYNRIGRAYPDVSASGARDAAVEGGLSRSWSGTSCSAPIFASVINRINEERVAIGKRPVGFINPVIYARPWMLNDVTNGSNVGCFMKGFGATEGWDPASGLGTPIYPRMLEEFLQLP